MSTQQIVPFKEQVNTVRALLDKSKEQFALALPRHVRVDQFLRVAMTTIQKNPDLLKCTQTSLLGCLMESAQLGLQVDGLLGEAYLVPFNNKQKDGSWRKECQLVVGYRGYMKLGRNSGEVSTFKARAVFKGDHFLVQDGLDPKLEHVRSEQGPQLGENEPIENAVRGAYAIVRMKDGSANFVFLWKWEIDRARASSKMAERGAWVTNYPEMAEKTAIRRLAKYMPQSPEIQRAAALEDLADAGISQQLGDAIDVSATDVSGDGNGTGTGSKLDQLVDADKAAKESAQPQPTFAPQPQEPPKSAGRGKARAETPAPQQQASTPQGNPSYADGDDGDPFKDQSLFNREPGMEG